MNLTDILWQNVFSKKRHSTICQAPFSSRTFPHPPQEVESMCPCVHVSSWWSWAGLHDCLNKQSMAEVRLCDLLGYVTKMPCISPLFSWDGRSLGTQPSYCKEAWAAYGETHLDGNRGAAHGYSRAISWQSVPTCLPCKGAILKWTFLLPIKPPWWTTHGTVMNCPLWALPKLKTVSKTTESCFKPLHFEVICYIAMKGWYT